MLIDVTNSWAVLIGTASHTPDSDLEDLPAVRNNLTDLAAALMDPGILGLPQDQILTLLDPTEADMVGDTIRAAGEKASGTLIVYYAGHGLPEEDGQLFLALTGTRSKDLPYHALPFQWVAKGIRRSRADAHVLILDCCYAGLSQPPTMSGKDLVAEQSTIAGTWALFSSAYDTPSLAPPGASYTTFTGALIDLLNSGIRGGPKDLDGGTILEALRRRLLPRAVLNRISAILILATKSRLHETARTTPGSQCDLAALGRHHSARRILSNSALTGTDRAPTSPWRRAWPRP